MKKYRKIILPAAVILAVEILISAIVMFSFSTPVTDEEKLNHIIMTVRENWYNPEIFEEMDFGTDILLFNTDNRIVYTSSSDMFSGIDSAVKAAARGYTCLPVSDIYKNYGTAVIPDEQILSVENARRRLIAAEIIMTAVMLFTALGFVFYAEYKIFRPFRKLKNYAGLIAQGRLDEPLMMDRNNLFGDFTVSFDIMRDELRKSRIKETELRIREKELVASLSHDLKTPVTGIKLLCELLSVRTQDKYITEKVENINQKAEQINVLISDLLTSTLDDLGEMNVSVNDEDSDILSEIISLNDTANLVSEYEIPECIISVDRNRISQVIGNIISNSYKYAGTAIDISSRINGRFLEMCIRDYGPGVPDDEIIYVTNKFYRGKNNSGKEGSGLGLYIASAIMEKTGGELICSSSEKGFTVTLLIPLS